MVVICLIAGAICLVGATIPVPGIAALQQFDCTPKPCWNGLHQGVSIVDAVKILRADKSLNIGAYSAAEHFICWNWQGQESPPGTYLNGGCYYDAPQPNLDYWLLMNYPQNPPRLGDIFNLIGRPNSSILCMDSSGQNMGTIYTTNGVSIEVVGISHDSDGIDPDLPVWEVNYLYPDSYSVKFMSQFHWLSLSRWSFVTSACGG